MKLCNVRYLGDAEPTVLVLVSAELMSRVLFSDSCSHEGGMCRKLKRRMSKYKAFPKYGQYSGGSNSILHGSYELDA